MTYATPLIGLIYIIIAYLLTEDNAKYLLSGYNTMTHEERKKFNMKAFIPYFKKFHIFLGISTIMLGLLINILINNKASIIALALYSISAYIYFIIKSNRFYIDEPPISSKLALIFLSIILVFLTVIIIYNY